MFYCSFIFSMALVISLTTLFPVRKWNLITTIIRPTIGCFLHVLCTPRVYPLTGYPLPLICSNWSSLSYHHSFSLMQWDASSYQSQLNPAIFIMHLGKIEAIQWCLKEASIKVYLSDCYTYFWEKWLYKTVECLTLVNSLQTDVPYTSFITAFP